MGLFLRVTTVSQADAAGTGHPVGRILVDWPVCFLVTWPACEGHALEIAEIANGWRWRAFHSGTRVKGGGVEHRAFQGPMQVVP